jgi:copper(I)-binding protein
MNRIGVLGAVLLALLALAGCGSAPTTTSANFDRTRIGLDSVDGQVGRLRLLSVSIASPGARGSVHLAGSSAALLLTVANDGTARDVLDGASADVAERIVFRDGDGAARRHWETPVPPGGVAVLREVTGPHLELAPVRETLRSGFSVPITFRFRDAGPVTLEVPIRTYNDVPVDRVPQPLTVSNR